MPSTPQSLTARLYAAPVLLLTLTALMWAGNTIASQVAKGEISPMTLILVRWIAVTAIMWPLFGAEVRAAWPTVRHRLGWMILVATLGFTGFNALFYYAALSTSAVNMGILQGAIPVVVLIGAYLAYRTPVTPAQGLGVLATMVGVALVAARGDLSVLLGLALNAGDLLMLAAATVYALYAVALRARPEMSGGAFFTMLTPIAALTAMPLAAIEWATLGFFWPTPTGWGVAAFVTIFPSCLAQLFFLRGVDLIGPGRAGVYVNLVPVFAPLLAVVLLGQTFALYHAIALCLVLGGIWLAQRTGRA
ncbi:MAG: DMT family transporter [Pseudomonadota bacterium]